MSNTKPTTSELRKAFLDYFAAQGHEVVPSSSLVPFNDPTLLFTNAGMVQFKDVFLGRETRAVPRATSAQRCVRAGGKHNDLENVGYTARHHTFFEMLGNFSFGDYFKREAIRYAWEFVTGELGLPAERLWCTVFEDDDEAADIWLRDIGVDPGRFARLGKHSNFWAMGDTGPCGPCSEIFYDHGDGIEGGPPGSENEDGDRYVEIWNLVFMQFERDAGGRLSPLPKPSVDTGMGLERLAAVMQGVHSNYEIDLFVRLIGAAAEITRAPNRADSSLRVIADHIRSCSFLIADGVLPSNEGRGYVLRRIIRRAVRHGYKLGVEAPFFHRLVAPLAEEMGGAYPELVERREHVQRVLEQEEQRFSETLAQGMRLLEAALAGLPSGGTLSGETVFKLYDTYGFPEDLTADIARERNFRIDPPGFEAAMAAQRDRARKASRFAAAAGGSVSVEVESQFVGYESLAGSARVSALLRDGRAVEALETGEQGTVVLDVTPFYAEGGGQVGDHGRLETAAMAFDVEDTQKLGDAHGHHGRVLRGRIAVGDTVDARVDAARRGATVLNHSATHLLHAALREVLGEHVQQKGSLVAPDRLRFDFAHYQALTENELDRIEALVNEEIRANAAAEIEVLPYKEALARGAMAFFGDKYGERVRMLKFGDFSTELCGGTHVVRTGDIGFFKIVSESGIAAGVRRIEAVTGRNAWQWSRDADHLLRRAAGLVRGGREDVVEKIEQLLERGRGLEREIEGLKRRLASGANRDLAETATDVGGTRVVAARLDGADAKTLREAADQLKQRLGSAVVVLGAVEDGKVRLVASVTKDLTARVKAGAVIGPVAEHVGGRGGGRDDFAQAGGSEPDKLDGALALVPDLVGRALG